LREEWAAHLAGESGRGLSVSRKTKAAVGFVIAAIRYRSQDAADLVWKPVDAVLKSRAYSNLLVITPTAAAAVIIFRRFGAYDLLHSAEDIAAIGASLSALIAAGRRYRNVKPRKPKSRQKD
jgi:hypothetical protein